MDMLVSSLDADGVWHVLRVENGVFHLSTSIPCFYCCSNFFKVSFQPGNKQECIGWKVVQLIR